MIVTRPTCQICNARTERRELPSGARPAAVGIEKTVSYWCPRCRRWESTDEVASDAAPWGAAPVTTTDEPPAVT